MLPLATGFATVGLCMIVAGALSGDSHSTGQGLLYVVVGSAGASTAARRLGLIGYPPRGGPDRALLIAGGIYWSGMSLALVVAGAISLSRNDRNGVIGSWAIAAPTLALGVFTLVSLRGTGRKA
jgi:hypothetical protein